jgi:hypothetical protein
LEVVDVNAIKVDSDTHEAISAEQVTHESEIPSQEALTPTEQENTNLLAAEEGINKALEEVVVPAIFKIGEVMQTPEGKAILIDYNLFVKYTYGLIILGNPGMAALYVSQAGKGKLFQLLRVTDRELQDKIWSEFKQAYNDLYNKR